jgi:hypothetical protein
MDTYVGASRFGPQSIAFVKGDPRHAILEIVDAAAGDYGFDSMLGGYM